MKNSVKIERAVKDITQQDLAAAVLAMKIARYFGKPTESIFKLEEND